MKTSGLHVVAALAAGISAVGAVAVLQVVSFKDAAKIKSWDAWGDGGKTPTTVSVVYDRERRQWNLDTEADGMVVNVKGVRVFVPASQSGLPKEAEMSQLLKLLQLQVMMK